MNRLFLLVVFITSMAKAQTFDFSCAPETIEGTIIVNGIPALASKAFDPQNEGLGMGSTFNLTTPGVYTIKAYTFVTQIRTITITSSGNNTYEWSEL